jgi:hypothetical protein
VLAVIKSLMIVFFSKLSIVFGTKIALNARAATVGSGRLERRYTPRLT